MSEINARSSLRHATLYAPHTCSGYAQPIISTPPPNQNAPQSRIQPWLYLHNDGASTYITLTLKKEKFRQCFFPPEFLFETLV
ncbi:hypothetical protein FKM82_015903 [Ascaphus truei]